MDTASVKYLRNSPGGGETQVKEGISGNREEREERISRSINEEDKIYQ